MDKSNQKSNVIRMNEQEYKQRLKNALATEQLEEFRDFVKKMALELNIDMLDCAAALASINLQKVREEKGKKTEVPEERFDIPLKMLRYRIEVGRKHSLDEDLLKRVLVEEAGVEMKMIGPIDIRFVFTLLELPEGMPEDIFQHLKNVEINQQKLHIKRINNRNQNHRNKGGFRRTRNNHNKKTVVAERAASIRD